jgi:hypothetical protein
VEEEASGTDWRRNLRVFLLAYSLSAVLMLCGGCFSFLDAKPPTPGRLRASDVVLWLFAFPFKLAEVLGWDLRIWAPGLALLTPLYYGSMWWFAWRMWTLFRRKAESGDTHPSHPSSE